MRTAIILLLTLAAGAGVGTFFPQRPIDPRAVAGWVERNPGWAPVVEKLGLFDVYGAWWFMAIYALLLVSLVGCLVPRWRAWARALGSRPRHRSVLANAPRYQPARADAPPGAVLDGAERALRTRRFRVERSGDAIAAERGHWREGGSLVFHTAFLVLLLGVAMGKVYGHSGQAAVIEGERFTDTHIDYDFITEGRFYGERHSGMTVEVERFDVSWYPNGVPREFVSHVRLYDGDGTFLREEAIRVNAPLTHRGVRVYQLSWGYAPRVRVLADGKVLYDAHTVFLPTGDAWRGVVKVPGVRPQVGLEMLFLSDPQIDDDGIPFNASQEATNPMLVFQDYRGDLGLTVPQSVYELDRTLLVAGEGGVVRLGERFELPGGVVVEFPELRRWSGFQIATNPGAPVLFSAAVMILVGLMPALYGSRRRVWVRVAPDGDGGSRIEVAGQALQRAGAFEEEFASIVRSLDVEVTAARTPVEAGVPDG